MWLSNLEIILDCVNFAYKCVITFESPEPDNAHVCVDNTRINSISASIKMNPKGAIFKDLLQVSPITGPCCAIADKPTGFLNWTLICLFPWAADDWHWRTQ